MWSYGVSSDPKPKRSFVHYFSYYRRYHLIILNQLSADMLYKFFDLPLCIVASILCDWSTMKQLGYFDEALCNHKQRHEYIHIWQEDRGFQINNNGSTLTEHLVRWVLARGRHVAFMNFDQRRNYPSVDINSQLLLLFNTKRVTAFQSTSRYHECESTNPTFWLLLRSCVNLIKLDITIKSFNYVETLLTTQLLKLTELSLQLPSWLNEREILIIANNLTKLTRISISTSIIRINGYYQLPDVDNAYKHLMLKNNGLTYIEIGPIKDTVAFVKQIAILLPNVVIVALFATYDGYHLSALNELTTRCFSLKRFGILRHSLKHCGNNSVDYELTRTHTSLECYGKNNMNEDIEGLCALLTNVPITRLWFVDNSLLSDDIILTLFKVKCLQLTNVCFWLFEKCSVVGFSTIVQQCPNVKMLRFVTHCALPADLKDEEILNVFASSEQKSYNYEYFSIEGHQSISTNTAIAILKRCPYLILSEGDQLFKRCPCVDWQQVVSAIVCDNNMVL